MHSRGRQRGVAGSVGVVDDRVEGLVDPLPEHRGRRRLVERYHAWNITNIVKNWPMAI